MSKVKVIVKTDEFEVELPCDMQVSDNPTKGWGESYIRLYDNHRTQPWVSNLGTTWKYARPVPKPKMVPWGIDDFRKAWEDNMIFKSNNANRYGRIGIFDEDSAQQMHIGGQWFCVREGIEDLRKQDGSKLEKEV